MVDMNFQFNIAGFTHRGMERETNQDRILIQDSVYKEGLYSFSNVRTCFCFVADGIGGGPSGELASQFVLEQINTKIGVGKNYSREDLRNIFHAINSDLMELGKANPLYRGSGTTLVGLIMDDNQFHVINAGDSEAYVLRNKTLLKITEDQVLDPLQSNSPLTSYFGGRQDDLRLDFDSILRSVVAGDILLLTSDGLFKSSENKQVSAILSSSKTLENKAKFILQKALESGATDNLGCILIETTQTVQNSYLADSNTDDVSGGQ